MTNNKSFLLAIDQGTTSTRAILFDGQARPVASHAIPLKQIYPANGWVEHDPAEIWQAALACCRQVLKGRTAAEVAGIGITNQRETSLIWDRKSGAPLYNAIVWQDRRGAARCAQLKKRGLEAKVARKTGLLLDPYFSATKLEWLLRDPDLRARAARGKLAAGTIETWLVAKLTGGRIHVSDHTNASRTLLYDIRVRDWDADLLALFGVPREVLPSLASSSQIVGELDSTHLGFSIPIGGLAGDQQAALFGQGCVDAGMAKNTYGTGAFLLVLAGSRPPVPEFSKIFFGERAPIVNPL